MFKKILLSTSLLLSAQSFAVDPIYFGGTKYSYNINDFQPIIDVVSHNGSNVSYTAGYETLIDVYVDEYDDFYQDYPTLIFDARAEVSAINTDAPLILDYAVTCSGTDIGNDLDVVFSRQGRMIPARLTTFNTLKTNGTCKQLKVTILKQGNVTQNIESDINAIKFSALIGLALD